MLVLALAVALTSPSFASASRQPADRVGDTTLATSAALRTSAPDIVASSGILTTADGRTLWSRAPDAERAMASTTKIMTAVVVLEHGGLDELATVSPVAAAVGESGANLAVGERLTVRQLLEVMMVHSANDSAIVLAEHTAGSVPAFVKAMNAEAKKLGLDHTAFRNPHGLDQTGHYTSARDLDTLARYAMGLDLFRKIVAMRKVTIPAPKGQKVTFPSSNELLGKYPGLDGVKTGFTDRAGYCLAASAERGGIRLFAVVLGTSSLEARFEQTRRVLDWGFREYHRSQVATAGAAAGSVPVSDYLDRSVRAIVKETTSAPVFGPDGAFDTAVSLVPSVQAPVRRGDRLGVLTVRQEGRTIALVPLVAASDVVAPGFWERAGIFFTRTWRALFVRQGSAKPQMTG